MVHLKTTYLRIAWIARVGNSEIFAHLDGADKDFAVDAVVDGDGVAPVEEVDMRVVAVLDLELLTADRSRLSSSLAVN